MITYSINNLSDCISKKNPSSIVVLTDDKTARFCLPLIEELIIPGIIHINVPSGENSKSLTTLEQICTQMLENNADRNSLLINLGGGMISDLGGFCAATYKRGISFINIPTTLLAMVDASVGGKTGVNIGRFKNQVGLFADPESVLIDPVFLKTLPPRELISGYAEMIKYGLIFDSEFLKELMSGHPLTKEDWLPVIQRCIELKEEIVAKDPKEQGLRKVLNFGHTIGHAIESYSLENERNPLLHGEAVALGMMAELYLSCKKTGLDMNAAVKITDQIRAVYQHLQFPVVDNEVLLHFMKMDKKNTDGEIGFALLDEIGHAVYNISCSEEEIREALDFCKPATVQYSDYQLLKIISRPETLSGKIQLPSSKSISNRVLVIEALCGTKFEILNLSEADDTVLMQALQYATGSEIYVKNAGTVARFLLAFYASRPCDVILKGDHRMSIRPIGELVNALKAIGADIEYLEKETFLPVHIHGRHLRGGAVSVPANISSQFISALLMIAPTLENGLSLEITGEIVSEPYINLTLKTMSHFGINYAEHDHLISVPPQKYIPRPIVIESDWSSASYFWALAALFPGSELHFDNLWDDSWQGDSILKEIIKEFCIDYTFENGTCRIKSWVFEMDYFEYDFINCPDLIPTFVCLCCALKIPFKMKGTRTLQYKESNRAEVLKTELAKLGYNIGLDENEITFDGIQNLNFVSKSPKGYITLNPDDDHRMVMSFMLLAIKNPDIYIQNSGCVNKSFPAFWTEIEKLGFAVQNEKRSFSLKHDSFQIPDIAK